MVTKSETTAVVTQPKTAAVSRPSFKRWFRHFMHMPAAKRYFNKQDQHAIAHAVEQAEQGHIGEIQVVIEGHIPAHQAYYQDVRGRAEQLFAELGVWDTELNSGVLLYLNLCERKVEIVIDRGIKQATPQQVWDDICSLMVEQMKQQQYRQAMVQGVFEIGKALADFYQHAVPDQKNELPNAPIMLE
ncbi:TPM domain-containing protein [Acinetobacter sp.]|uniref:TPM domain-containing protein n=1 Tax=Acinetobacter sp. TaxID=472 RepID=UPI0035AEB1A0